jgi:manganese efflux pump family protein
VPPHPKNRSKYEMSLITLLLVALGLAADCFAVAVGTSMTEKGNTRWRWLRFATSFGVFQSAMIVIGWLAGRTVVEYVSGFDHWVAFALLAFVGGKMIWEFFHEGKEEGEEEEQTKGASLLTLITLSLATSIDALAVGLSFAFLEVNLLAAALIIGAASFIITGLGFFIGKRTGRFLGRWAELVGGLVLLGIGIRILLEHMMD